jgi:hypothetical protein
MAKPRRFVCAMLALVFVPARGFAQDHVVSAADVQARLVAASSERAHHSARSSPRWRPSRPRPRRGSSTPTSIAFEGAPRR